METTSKAPGPDLVVRLSLADGQTLEGRVTMIASDCLSARFAVDSGLALPLGTRVPVSLASSGRSSLHEARVMGRSSQDDGLEYTFHATGGASFTENGNHNRRAAFRLAVGDKHALGVTLFPYERADTFAPIHAHIADVSRLGIGLGLPDDAEDTLYAVERVRLEFALPGDEELFQFVGFVRQRRFRGVFLRYGVEFDAARTERYAAQEERVNRYVLRRQLDAMRRMNRWSEAS